MKIETYSDLHYLDVVRLVELFHKEAVSEYVGAFDLNVLINTITGFKESQAENCFLLTDDDGCHGILFGVMYKSPASERLMFQEMVWYVEPDYRKYGVKLLREVEKRLKLRQVGTIIMAVLENSKTEKIKSFYQRLGYKPIEVHYARDL